MVGLKCVFTATVVDATTGAAVYAGHLTLHAMGVFLHCKLWTYRKT